MNSMNSKRTGGGQRMVRLLALGVTLSLAPVAAMGQTASADSPATVVTGLSVGARGDGVLALQSALVAAGIDVEGGVDGIFGPGTEAAVRSFQSAEGLAVSGTVDNGTALSLGLASSPFLGLTQGNRSPAVAQLQSALIAAGIDVEGGVDGIFGPGTTMAVKEFQTEHAFASTGVVNAATAGALGAVTARDVDIETNSQVEGTSSVTDVTDADEDGGDTAAGNLIGLQIGSSGSAVQRLQTRLLDVGIEVVGGADGVFGVLTANALVSFQDSQGLPTSGKVDEATAQALSGASQTAPADADSASPLLGLKYGSLGEQVKALQERLMAAGITVRGGADGVYGTVTIAAVKELQTARGVEATGWVDAATVQVLGSPIAAVTAANPMLGLKAGVAGTTVATLQQALIDAGVAVRGGADGIFGPVTSQALKSFQTAEGLEATGVVDAATLTALANPTSPTNTEGSSDQPELGYPSYGERGERVMALQSALVQAGIELRGGVDGDFGSGTSGAIMTFQSGAGLSVTGKVNTPTAEALGLSAAAAPAAFSGAAITLAAFPVDGACQFTDTWQYTRGGGRLHLGVDIIAAGGTPLVAAVDGKITKIYTDHPGSLSGNGVRITMADGTYLFYAHMRELAEGIEVGVPVTAGQLVGLVGTTGSSGTNHLHLEVHPKGGSAVNPYPIALAAGGC